jgi:hypothetical protein
MPGGSYVIDALLARGGMGAVYRGRRRGPEGFERAVAIKRMDPRGLDDAELVALFAREARTAARLHHRNLVSVLDFGHDAGGRPYLVMDLCEGVTLAELLAVVPAPPVALVLRIATEVLAALDHAERHGVVHRDVSPDNVLLGWDGEVRLSDFGVAKAEWEPALTAAGIVRGKRAYLSPEQACGLALDGRSDQFALGILLWEALAGRRLFRRPGDGPDAVVQRVLELPIPPPSSERAELPSALDACVVRMLRRGREERFPSSAVARAALLDAHGPAAADEADLAAFLAVHLARTRGGPLVPEADDLPTGSELHLVAPTAGASSAVVGLSPDPPAQSAVATEPAPLPTAPAVTDGGDPAALLAARSAPPTGSEHPPPGLPTRPVPAPIEPRRERLRALLEAVGARMAWFGVGALGAAAVVGVVLLVATLLGFGPAARSGRAHTDPPVARIGGTGIGTLSRQGAALPAPLRGPFAVPVVDAGLTPAPAPPAGGGGPDRSASSVPSTGARARRSPRGVASPDAAPPRVDVIGGLSAASAARVVAALVAERRRCGATAIGRLDLVVTAAGGVRTAASEGAPELPGRDCLLAAARRLGFPPTTDGGFATVTIRFPGERP